MPATEEDIKFMRVALDEARRAASLGEVPVGAVIVSKNQIVGRGHNLTETLNDVTAHAEIQAITAAAGTLGGKYLSDCALYVTVEPCLMCAGAIAWARIRRLVIGAPDPKRGYSVLVNRSPFHPRCEIITGILAPDCASLMTSFFASRR